MYNIQIPMCDPLLGQTGGKIQLFLAWVDWPRCEKTELLHANSWASGQSDQRLCYSLTGKCHI